MMQPITFVGAILCFGVLIMRYRSQPKNRPRRTTQQKLKTAKILFAALLVWMGILYSLRRLDANLDGAAPEPTVMERVVQFLSRL